MAVAAIWRRGRSIPVAHFLVTSFLGVAAIYVARLGGFFFSLGGFGLLLLGILLRRGLPRRGP